MTRGMIAHRKLFAPPTPEDVMMVCFDAIASTKSRPRVIVFQGPDFLPRTFATGEGVAPTGKFA